MGMRRLRISGSADRSRKMPQAERREASPHQRPHVSAAWSGAPRGAPSPHFSFRGEPDWEWSARESRGGKENA